jgi:hypothetical protein
VQRGQQAVQRGRQALHQGQLAARRAGPALQRSWPVLQQGTTALRRRWPDVQRGYVAAQRRGLAAGRSGLAMAQGWLASARDWKQPGNRQLRPNWTLVLGVALLLAIGLLGYGLIAGSGSSGHSAQAAGTRHQAGQRTQHSSHPPATPLPSPSAAQQQPLSPVSATAFGPAGTSQGDNPELAPLAINGNQSAGWHTDWYATPAFGNMQSGTGLLLDMGRAVTITSAQMVLGSSPGADLQLRAGNSPSLAELPAVAGAKNADGSVQLSLSSPVTCRYVLIWFTGLPPDQSGTFQASVSDVKLTGQT